MVSGAGGRSGLPNVTGKQRNSETGPLEKRRYRGMTRSMHSLSIQSPRLSATIHALAHFKVSFILDDVQAESVGSTHPG
jgi:hypothetical protein